MPRPDRITPVTVQCSATWKAWVRSCAIRARTTASELIDRALVELAERRGYPTAPPRINQPEEES